MLEGLDKINWAKHKGAYHLKEKLPAYIRDLASDDFETREKAFDNVIEEINHQGSIYDATPYVVPFLIELLSIDSVQEKERLLYQIFHLLNCCNDYLIHTRGIGEPSIQNCFLTYQNLAEGVETFITCLDHPALEVRLSAVLTLSELKTQITRTRKALRKRYCIESDLELRAVFLVKLGSFYPFGYAPSAKRCRQKYEAWFLDLAESASELLIRLAASIAWARSYPYGYRTSIPQPVLDAFIWGLGYTHPSGEIAWAVDLNLNSDGIIGCIKSWGYEQMTLLLKSPTLTTANIHKLARELLDLSFDRKSTRAQYGYENEISWKWWEFEKAHLNTAPKEMIYRHSDRPRYFSPSQKLDRRQREVIAAIVECDRFWELPTNVFSFFYDLPDSRNALRELIASS